MSREIIIRRCFGGYIINRKLINSKLRIQVGREKHEIGNIYNNFTIDNIYDKHDDLDVIEYLKNTKIKDLNLYRLSSELQIFSILNKYPISRPMQFTFFDEYKFNNKRYYTRSLMEILEKHKMNEIKNYKLDEDYLTITYQLKQTTLNKIFDEYGELSPMSIGTKLFLDSESKFFNYFKLYK